MKILCFGYRTWALEIYDRLLQIDGIDVKIFIDRSLVNLDYIHSEKPDLVLFYGWSWKISAEILQAYRCIMLHPSELPKYRGGSPIQNQILDGVKISAVTLFRMTNEMDAGPVLKKCPLLLDGEIDDIFNRLSTLGTALTMELILENPDEKTQDSTDATYCKRRTPDMSEITILEIQNQSGQYLFNKVRCLTGPYPRAYITAGDGVRLYIEKASLSSDKDATSL